jgi:hypothetical protein
MNTVCLVLRHKNENETLLNMTAYKNYKKDTAVKIAQKFKWELKKLTFIY